METTTQQQTTTEIKLVQKPVIEHRLREIGASVTERLEALGIDKLVATEDSMKALKELRAELNKELASFEGQRKTLKNAITAPYAEFEELYKTEISEKYNGAVTMLKDKIATVETQIKDDKHRTVLSYFEELCASVGIDFLTWEKLNIEINLSTSLKKYKEQVNEFITRVQEELGLIETNEYKAEILVEYKRTLRAADAITTVQERKKREAEERKRIRQQEVNKRIDQISNLGMTLIEVTQTYEYNEEIQITLADIDTLSPKEFTKRFIQLEDAIKKAKAEEPQPEGEAPTEKKPAPAITAPTVSQPFRADTKPTAQSERIVTASFEVTGPYSAVKALGQYMKDHNLKYKNI